MKHIDGKPLTHKQYIVLFYRMQESPLTYEQIAKKEKVTRWAIRKRVESIRKKGINPKVDGRYVL
tara:strand:+ start:34 stop:228 length:195 start_codon:yes stop_codon:yes gene_type:complete